MNYLKAIVLTLISSVMFAAMSALVRYVGDVVPVGQVVFFRAACAIPPVLLVYGSRCAPSVRSGISGAACSASAACS